MGGELFIDTTAGEAPVRGYLHEPSGGSDSALVLTHGAGGNCNAPLLVALAEELSRAGVTGLRCDLPFRQARPKGAPSGSGEKDQEGLRRAVTLMKKRGAQQCFLGGQSYGGRQASMLAAKEPGLVEGLLLLSYPLHPPGKPTQLRTAHFPALKTRTLFVQGTKDPFGAIEELEAALKLIPAGKRLVVIEGAGHGVKAAEAERVVRDFAEFFGVAG